ncbi:hypothetical protein HPB47_005186 [Ixodes persulcatus]|uniref:Uncharacterized protein n=1 Tax=Ixodes persulcatus TaxID=34615 RepID=A0AC60PDN8_IXOPE|nr:hypothetical protein HPB47_005186 [Ixodes persulcatus]
MPSSRQRSKSYAFATEAYTLPSSVMTNVCDSSHILATLRLIILLKTNGYKETPPELSCTELPQQWRRPRRQGIRPSVQDVDWRSPREGGVPTPKPVRLFDACAKKQDEQRQLELLHELGRTLQSLGNQDLGAVLLAARGPLTDTKLGPAPAGSQLSYQQAMLPSGYKTWTSANISAGIGLATSVPELSLFDGTPQHTFSGMFSAEEWQILTESAAYGNRRRQYNTLLGWLVYDPEELSYGVLEIKCPYSIKDTEPDYARMQNFYITFNENDESHLDRDHDHYAQLLSQLFTFITKSCYFSLLLVNYTCKMLGFCSM